MHLRYSFLFQIENNDTRSHQELYLDILDVTFWQVL